MASLKFPRHPLAYEFFVWTLGTGWWRPVTSPPPEEFIPPPTAPLFLLSLILRSGLLLHISSKQRAGRQGVLVPRDPSEPSTSGGIHTRMLFYRTVKRGSRIPHLVPEEEVEG